MVWYFFERYYESIKHFQTAFGNLWYANVFCFRIFCTTVIGEELFDDDQLEFICDTGSPGCKQVCFNDFSPISLIRFWSFSVLINMSPIFLFHLFALREVKFSIRGNDERRRKLVDYREVIDGFEKVDLGLMGKPKVRDKPLANETINSANTTKLMRSQSENSKLYHRANTSNSNTNKPQKPQNSTPEPPNPQHLANSIKYLQTKLLKLSIKRENKKSTKRALKSNKEIISTRTVAKIYTYYVAHCVLKICLECLFLYLGYRIQTKEGKINWEAYVENSVDKQFENKWDRFWLIPEKFNCNHGWRYRETPDLTPFFGVW